MRLSTAMRPQLASTTATCAVTVTTLVALMIAALSLLAAADASAAAPKLRAVRAHPSPASDGTISPAARRALRQGYLVPNQHAYENQKRAAAKAAPTHPFSLTAPFSTPAQLAPSINRSWSGQASPGFAPSDSTGAAGNSNFIQLVNSKFAIYNKSNSAPLSTGSLNTLANASSADTLFDVQVIWDPTTKRFYYTMIDEVNAVTNELE